MAYHSSRVGQVYRNWPAFVAFPEVEFQQMAGPNDSFVYQATDAVKAGRFQEGLDLSRSGLVSSPNNADLKLLEAISLSYLGIKSEASDAFMEAIRLAPGSSKARYNAAAHEYRCQNMEQAKILAQHALQIEPSHEAAKQLLQAIDPTAAAPTGSYGFGTPPVSAYPRGGSEYLDVPNAGIPFITKLGKGWSLIGWLIAATGTALFINGLLMVMPHAKEILAVSNSGKGPADMTSLQAKMDQGTFIQVLGWAMIPINIAYMILDLIHKRGNMLWLLPHVPCSICGMGWVTLPVYLAVEAYNGRNSK
jgi:tetratricopeptide (TPR) repeat protein